MTVPFKYGAKFQDNMLSLMLKDVAFADKCLQFVPEEYLHSDAHKWLFEIINERYEVDGSIPSQVEVEELLRRIPKGKRRTLTRFVDRIVSNDPESPEYIRDELKDFARRAQFAELFAHGQTLYNAGEHDEAYLYVLEQINHLHAINFNQEETIDIELFEKVRNRYLSQIKITGGDVSTMIPDLDSVMAGGLSPVEGELGVLIAEAKTGKSIGLIHMGYAGAIVGKKVAHFVLEGNTEQTMMRYQSRFTRIPYHKIRKDELDKREQDSLDKVTERYAGNLRLIPMNTEWDYTTADVEAKLKEFDREGWRPDLLVIDYADLLKSRHSEHYRREDLEQRDVYREIKSIAMTRRLAIWTASQARRPNDRDTFKKRTLGSGSVAESFEKIRIADFLATLNQSPEEKRMGMMRMHCDRYRSNSSGRTIFLITDFSRMIFHHKIWGTIKPKFLPEKLK